MSSYKTSILLVTFLVLVGITFLSLQYLSLRGQELLNYAVDGCLQAASYVQTDTSRGVTTTAPIEDVYQDCMNKKGY